MIGNIHKLGPFIRHWHDLICNGLLDRQVLGKKNQQLLGLIYISMINNNLMELHKYIVKSEIRPQNLRNGTLILKSCIYPSSTST